MALSMPYSKDAICDLKPVKMDMFIQTYIGRD